MPNSNFRTYLLPAIFGVLALFYVFPFLLDLLNWGIRDWDRSFVMAAIPGDAFFRYGQFPFWNPYMGGGNIFFQHPEVLVLSPYLLLYLIFGPVIGLKLQVLVCYFVGLWGTYRLAQTMGLSVWSAVMTAVAYFGSVYFALHFAEGHVTFVDFSLLPWFLTFILESKTRPIKLIWAAVAIALMILGNGGAAPLLYTMLFSVCFFCLYAFHTRSVLLVVHAGIALVGGIALSAIKFIPMMAHYSNAPQEGVAPEKFIPLDGLYHIFFGFNQTLDTKLFPEQVWSWAEYGSYISPLLALLAFVGLFFCFRKVWYWGVLLLVFLLLGVGNFGDFSPWSILRHLPGFQYTRCSGRAFQFVLLSCAILGGIGFDIIRHKLNNTGNLLWQKLIWIVPVCVIGTNMVLAWPIMQSAFPYPPQQVIYSPEFKNVVNDPKEVYRNFLENRGSVLAFVTLYSRFRALIDYRDTSIVSEAILSGSAHITSRSLTPNRIEYELEAERGGTFAVSQGYDLGWSVQDNRPVSRFEEVLSMPYSAGHDTIVLTYRPPYFFVGLTVSLLSLCLLMYCARRFAQAN